MKTIKTHTLRSLCVSSLLALIFTCQFATAQLVVIDKRTSHFSTQFLNGNTSRLLYDALDLPEEFAPTICIGVSCPPRPRTTIKSISIGGQGVLCRRTPSGINTCQIDGRVSQQSVQTARVTGQVGRILQEAIIGAFGTTEPNLTNKFTVACSGNACDFTVNRVDRYTGSGNPIVQVEDFFVSATLFGAEASRFNSLIRDDSRYNGIRFYCVPGSQTSSGEPFCKISVPENGPVAMPVSYKFVLTGYVAQQTAPLLKGNYRSANGRVVLRCNPAGSRCVFKVRD